MLKFNGVLLEEKYIFEARKYFVELIERNIDKVENGEKKVNNKEKFIKSQLDKLESYDNGLNDETFTFMQRAYYLQTGESVSLF